MGFWTLGTWGFRVSRSRFKSVGFQAFRGLFVLRLAGGLAGPARIAFESYLASRLRGCSIDGSV